ncbi:LOW QUALITY PROTEIN: suppressor of cytokine signaling 5-like [Lethenteron reissneri]|uniref:LOW QUALITY PROTEIN: suppressor of cytokine signaling 5-like n=1 Tax=Lethenteron reissneri TaxID=7753 RepID=UPI002AB73DCF|nr:LOW QUALITY PROTEIN: suppressor of cytokine signaling 5-like [Lethenteron reissneri]
MKPGMVHERVDVQHYADRICLPSSDVYTAPGASMERVEKAWISLKYKCHSWFSECREAEGSTASHPEGAPTAQQQQESPAHESPAMAAMENASGLNVEVADSGDKAAKGEGGSDIVVIVPEITVGFSSPQDGGSGAKPKSKVGAVNSLRDSYFRHAPWASKKKRSQSGGGSGDGCGGDDAAACLDADDLNVQPRLVGEEGRDGSADAEVESAEARVCTEHRFEQTPARSRTLRNRLQDTVGQCFPLCGTGARRHHASYGACDNSNNRLSVGQLSSKRKIHLSELMLDHCPFPAGSELARKWHLIKQHTAPVGTSVGPTRGPFLTASLDVAEDEEDALRERRRMSIEEGVDPPPDAQIHTFETTAQINPLCKLGPKLAPGMSQPNTPPAGHSGAGGESGSEDDELPLAVLAPPQRHRLESSSALMFSQLLCQQVQQQLQQSAAVMGAAAGPAVGGLVRLAHTQIDYIHCLVPDLLDITQSPFYWGVMDRYQAEALLEGRPEGTFLLRDSAQEDYLFSVSFRRYGRSLHARVEQWNHNFSFDAHDPCVFHAPAVTALLRHYKDPSACMFFEPLLATPLHRSFPFVLQRLCRASICGRVTYDGIDALPVPHVLKDYLKEYHYKQKVRVRRLDEPLWLR